MTQGRFLEEGTVPTLLPAMKIVRDALGIRYLAIPLSVVRLDSVTGFDLYLRAKGDKQFILYRRGDVPFDREQLVRLADSRVSEIFIPEAQSGAYEAYLEQHLDAIVSDPNLAIREKSRIVYACSTQLAKRALEQPWSGDSIAQVMGVASLTIKHLFQGKKHLLNLISMLHDDFTLYAHSVNVCVLGLGLAHHLGFSQDALVELGSGLLLHDLGKARVDPAILHKSTKLTPEEWKTIKAHPNDGVACLTESGLDSANVLAVVHQHHERCDGAGYPQGLSANEIHIFAKIASLADVFDGLTTAREDRPAHDSFLAIQIMQRDMAGAFNLELLRAFVLMLEGRHQTPARARTGANRGGTR